MEKWTTIIVNLYTSPKTELNIHQLQVHVTIVLLPNTTSSPAFFFPETESIK